MNEPEQTDAVTARLKAAFVTFAVLVVVFHLVVVTLAALPPNRYSEAARPTTSYLAPFFTQNWRLFAPEPVSSDRSVRFQGAYRVDGEVRTTEWVDWTDVELGVVRQRLIGGRAGYITNKMYTPLTSRFSALNPDQQEATLAEDPAQALSWTELERDVPAAAEAALGELNAARWIRYERSVTSLATAVLASRDPDVEIVAIRYSLRSQGVTPYEDRRGSATEREAARPEPNERISGWRDALPPDAAELDAVGGFDRRHR